VRGDVPVRAGDDPVVGWFSPRARGCSEHKDLQAEVEIVFPACAGMFLLSGVTCRSNNGFPRVRGDVPPRVLAV